MYLSEPILLAIAALSGIGRTSSRPERDSLYMLWGVSNVNHYCCDLLSIYEKSCPLAVGHL